MSKVKVRLQKSSAFTYSGMCARYTVTYDHASGRTGRYTVTMSSIEAPVLIGRELPLKDVRTLIADYEDEFQRIGGNYLGHLKTALRVLKGVTKRREEQCLKSGNNKSQES